MRLISYYAWHTLVNSIKKIFRSTVVVVIAMIFVIGFVFGISASIVSDMLSGENQKQTEYSAEAYEDSVDSEESDYGEDESSEELILTDRELHIIKLSVETGIAVLLLAFVLWGLYVGTKNGSDIFLMADVNFLFTAPMKPQSVLIFRLAFQMAATLMGSLYLAFQIPNLVVNLQLDTFAVAAIFLAWIFLLVFQKLVSVFAYTLVATHETLRRYVQPFVLGMVVVIAAIAGSAYLGSGRDYVLAMENTLGTKGTRWIPVVGWFKGMIMSAVDGEVLASLGYAALMAVSMGALIWIIWNMKADFYEDAMAGANTREEVQVAASEGRQVAGKERSSRIRRNGEMRGWGATTFFWKEHYNRRRFAKFGIVTNTMLVYFATAAAISVLLIQVVKEPIFEILPFVILVIVFFRNFGNPIAQESSKNWLFLTPDSPYKKVFAAMMAGSYACALDTLPALVLGMICLRENPLMVLLWWIMILSVDFMISAAGMFLEVLFPASALDTVKSMIQMTLKFLLIMVIVIVLALGYAFGGLIAGVILEIVVNLVMGGLIFLVYPSMFHDGIG